MTIITDNQTNNSYKLLCNINHQIDKNDLVY